MESRDAQEIIRMIEANWHCDFGKLGRELWRDMLEPYEAALVTRAVVALAKNPLPGNRARPNVADLRSIIVSLSRHESEDSWRALPSAPIPKPEWVKRWERAREAGDERVLPEQIPGYLELQAEHSDNLIAYALPKTPVSDDRDWVQAHEYAEITS